MSEQLWAVPATDREQAIFWQGAVVNAIKMGMVPVDQILALFDEPQPQFGTPRSPKWPTVRAAFLEKWPRCAICEGNTFLQVHHKMPYHLNPDLELDTNNLITLCERPTRNCHLTWGHFYNWRSYNQDIDKCVSFWASIRSQKEDRR